MYPCGTAPGGRKGDYAAGEINQPSVAHSRRFWTASRIAGSSKSIITSLRGGSLPRAALDLSLRVNFPQRSVSCAGARLERMKIEGDLVRDSRWPQRRDRSATGAEEPAKECGLGFPSAPQNVASLSADESTPRRIEPAGSPLGLPKERGDSNE